MLARILKKALCRSSICYTAVSMLYLIIMLDMYQTSANPYPLTLLRLFPLFFLISFANLLVTEIKDKGAWKLPVHFLIVTLDLIFFVWLPAKETLSPGSTLILFVIYLVLYAIGALIAKSFFKKKETTSDYQSVYTQNKGK